MTCLQRYYYECATQNVRIPGYRNDGMYSGSTETTHKVRIA